jgi:hypothetical protein
MQNGLGRPVSQASGEFSWAVRPAGYIAAYKDLVREFLSIACIAHRISVRRIPDAYNVSPRFICITSRMLEYATWLAVVVVTPNAVVIGLFSGAFSGARLIR